MVARMGDDEGAIFGEELRRATLSLPGDVSRWLARALRSNWFRIEAGAYETRAGGTVCPIVAAATVAGVWANGGLLSGDPDWGTPSGPSARVEDFAAYFDLCAEALSVPSALVIVREALGLTTPVDQRDRSRSVRPGMEKAEALPFEQRPD